MQTKNRLAIIGSVGVPANYGGFETLAEYLIEELATKNQITVYCSGKRYKQDERKKYYKGARLRYISLDANGIQSILYDTLSILHALFFSDVLLILGVAGAWCLPFVRLFTNKKIIISIDGIEWKRDKWNRWAKLYLYLAEKWAVRFSHIDISDNESIQDYTAARYGTLSRVIEYGADHTVIENKEIEMSNYDFIHTKYAFKVCRIEPENNIDMILEAFANYPQMNFVIIGNWENSDYGKNLKSKYASLQNIYLIDPIYDQNKLDYIRSHSYLYIHGHSAGGTNPSLIEAMYLGLPVFSFDVSYNRTTTENKAVYFQTKVELISKIQKFSESERKKLAETMKEVAHRRYQWEKVSIRFQRLIDEALQSNKKQSISSETISLSYNQLLDSGYSHLKTAQSI